MRTFFRPQPVYTDRARDRADPVRSMGQNMGVKSVCQLENRCRRERHGDHLLQPGCQMTHCLRRSRGPQGQRRAGDGLLCLCPPAPPPGDACGREGGGFHRLPAGCPPGGACPAGGGARPAPTGPAAAHAGADRGSGGHWRGGCAAGGGGAALFRGIRTENRPGAALRTGAILCRGENMQKPIKIELAGVNSICLRRLALRRSA